MKNNILSRRFFLRQKVLLTLTIISIVSLFVIGLIVFLRINKILIENKKSEILVSTIDQSRESSLIFKNNQLFTNMLSTRIRVREFLLNTKDKALESEITNLFREYTDRDKKFLAIYLLDKNGIGLLSTDERFIGQDYSFREYFKKSIRGEPFADVAIGKTSNQFGYYFSEPVYDDNRNILGIIVVKVDESDINAPIVSSEISKSSIIMLVDQFGIVLSSNQEDRKIKSLGYLNENEKTKIEETDKFLGRNIVSLQYDIVQQALRRYEKPIILSINDDKDGSNELLSLIKLDNFPFYIVTEIRLDILGDQVFYTVMSIVSIVLIIFVIISLLIYFLIIYFLRPVGKFKLFFEKISKGDFSKEVKVETSDEFYDMALSVNKMSKDLSGLYDDLDKKVKEQTVKIEEKAKESDDQNKAILNILEDVEIEKSKVENLANDLEKFKLAVENASDQIVITDVEGIVIYGNRAVEKITGYKPEEALGKKAGVLWKSPMSLEFYQNLWDVIKNKKKTFVGEIKNKRKSGDFYTAAVSISPVFNDGGDIIYFVAIERDITKEKEVDKAKTEFVSLASHQLRTPLSAINWYTEMLLAGDAGKINKEQRKYLEEVAIGNKRMVNLVDDLLNVSRLDMGTFIIEAKPVDVYKLLKSSLDENKVTILNKKLIINEEECRDIGEFQIDEKLLRIVFQNLISNAVKYTPASGEIKIYLSKLDKSQNFGDQTLDEDSLVFSIKDSGMGIPIYQQDKIYSKLFRADNAKESETEGTGLGLYVVKSIIDKSGGSIWFKSEENKGTTFYVSFPVSGMKDKSVNLEQLL